MLILIGCVISATLLVLMVWSANHDINKRQRAATFEGRHVRASCSNGEAVEGEWRRVQPYIERWLRAHHSIRLES